jgi:PAS domain S-box-containing protein
MKIKTQFTIATLIFCVIFVLAGSSLIYSYNEVNRLAQQEKIALDVVLGAYELSYLSNDYMFHPEEQRQNIQWDSRFEALSDDISHLSVKDPDQQVLVNRIIVNKDRLHDVYKQSVAAIETSKATSGQPVDPELIDIAWSRFVVQNQAMIFDASSLSELLRIESAQVQRVNTALVILLMIILLLFLVTNYVFIKRRILQSISALNSGTKIIGSGDLNFKINTGQDDEIGELSTAFNQMTINLNEVTTSKSNLEHEIAERKQAQQELSDARDNLEIQVRDRTAQLADTNKDLLAEIKERAKTEEKLRETEATIRALMDSPVDSMLILDPKGVIIDTNATFAARVGKNIAELIGADSYSLFSVDLAKSRRTRVEEVIQKGVPIRFEDKRGDMWLDQSIHPIFDAQDNLVKIAIVARDITDRKQMEEALRESEEKYHNLYRDSAIGIFHSTFEGKFIDVNPALAKMLGYDSPEEVITTISNIAGEVYAEHHPYDVSATAVLDSGGVLNVENRYRRKDGTLWYGNLHLRIVPDKQGRPSHYEGFVEDITGRKQAEEAIQQALTEKEVLLREIHHRVKNNLASIISLIGLQSASLKDPTAISLLKDLETRIRSIALVHESLYALNDLSRIRIATYTENLTIELFQVYGIGTHVQRRIEMGDITMPIETALPVGLVMNEIVTNSLKYAFPKKFSCNEIRGEPCTITISMQREGSDYLLSIADNGVGMSGETEGTVTQSLGLYLIRLIVMNQLHGNLEVNTSGGTAYSIRFPEPAVRERDPEE